jgi:hypothetical protein
MTRTWPGSRPGRWNGSAAVSAVTAASSDARSDPRPGHSDPRPGHCDPRPGHSDPRPDRGLQSRDREGAVLLTRSSLSKT